MTSYPTLTGDFDDFPDFGVDPNNAQAVLVAADLISQCLGLPDEQWWGGYCAFNLDYHGPPTLAYALDYKYYHYFGRSSAITDTRGIV
ncbi:hypothetical protein P7C71_g1101, partial [Lecanoromycetidae sp. Uapishka_2]